MGNKVNRLRLTGVIPATVYGKGVENKTIQVNTDAFIRLYKETGETGLIHLSVEGKEHPVLISNVQRDPVHEQVIHIEFHEVNLREKIKANVPVECIGEATAVKENAGTLLQIIDEVEVEALPTDLPEKIEIDVTPLAAVDDSIYIKDIPAIANVTMITEPDQIIVKIGQLLAPEPEPTPETVVEGAAPAEGEEGATPVAEAPKEEGKE